MTLASTVWAHGRWAPYCREREAASPSLSGTVPEMATAHVRVRSAARATWRVCRVRPPKHRRRCGPRPPGSSSSRWG